MTSPAGAGRDLHRLADDVAAIPRAALVAAVDELVALVDAMAPRFRGRLWAYGDVEGPDDACRARIQGVPVGSWSMVSYGTRPHRIGGSGRGGSRHLANGRTLLAFGPGRLAYGPVRHPGTSGRRTWDRIARAAAPVAFDAFDITVDKALG